VKDLILLLAVLPVIAWHSLYSVFRNWPVKSLFMHLCSWIYFLKLYYKFGIDCRIARANRNFHSVLMCAGVASGFAGVKLSGCPRI